MEWFHDGTRLRLMATPPPRTVAQPTNRCAWVAAARAGLCGRCGHYADRGGPVPPAATDRDHACGGGDTTTCGGGGTTTCGADELRRPLVRTPWTPVHPPGHYVPHGAPPPVTPPPAADDADSAAAIVDWITSAAVVAAAYAYAPAAHHYPATTHYPAYYPAGSPMPPPHQPQRSLRRIVPADGDRSLAAAADPRVSSTAAGEQNAASSPSVHLQPSAFPRRS